MGNQASRAGSAHLENLIGELPDMVYKDSLGGSRFFKTSLCVHDEGGLVTVKTYEKRAEFQEIRKYEDALIHIRSALSAIQHPHVWPVQRVYNSDNAVHLVRQYIWSSLSQRITSRPFLTLAEKKWIGYQFLAGVAQAHNAGICHGDIKTENVLLTSWGWAFLADFAPYKPTLLPADNPADFSFFFYTGGPRTCYLAPERFYDSHTITTTTAITTTTTASNNTASAATNALKYSLDNQPLLPSMDIFAVGCVLAELFTDGNPLFEYSQLLAYRSGKYDPIPSLQSALSSANAQKTVARIIQDMVQIDPLKRKSADEYLAIYASTVLDPGLCTVFHPFMQRLLGRQSELRADIVAKEYRNLVNELVSCSATVGDADATDDHLEDGDNHKDCIGSAATNLREENPLPAPVVEMDDSALKQQAMDLHAQATSLITQIRHTVNGFNTAIARVDEDHNHSHLSMQHSEEEGAQCRLPEQSRTLLSSPPATAPHAVFSRIPSLPLFASAGTSLHHHHHHHHDHPRDDRMVVLLSVLCSVFRGTFQQRTRTNLVYCIGDCAIRCGDDESRLQRALPYLVTAATVDASTGQLSAVRCAALRVLNRVLSCVRSVPAADARMFAEYLFPSLSLVPHDAEVAVQSAYAGVLSDMAMHSMRGVEMAQSWNSGGGGNDAAIPLQGHCAAATNSGTDTTRHGITVSVNFDDEVSRLRSTVERAVQDMLVGSHPETKLALLPTLDRLAMSLGPRDTADGLLPALLTLFNSREWQIRSNLYAHLAGVCRVLGPRKISFLFPFLDRMLLDPEPTAAAAAGSLMCNICRMGLMKRKDILAAVDKMGEALLLSSPSTAVRASMLQFLATAASNLSPMTSLALLLPLVKNSLTSIDSGEHTRHQHVSLQLHDVDALLAALPPTSYRSHPRGGPSHAAAEDDRRQWTAPIVSSSYSIVIDTRWLNNVSPSLSWMSAAVKMAQHATGTPDVMSIAHRNGMHRSHEHATSNKKDLECDVPVKSTRNGRVSSNVSPPGRKNNAVAWRPRGALIAHLAEHKRQVTRLAPIASTSLFVSASEDGTAMIWDTRRLERDISFRPRASFHSHNSSPLRAVCCIDDQGSVVSGSADGTVQLWNIARSGSSVVADGEEPLRRSFSRTDSHHHHHHPGDGGGYAISGAIMDIVPVQKQHHAASVAVATQYTGVYGIDIRSPQHHVWHVQQHASMGVVTRLVAPLLSSNSSVGDCYWLVSGTSRGYMTLWDLRFFLPVNTWNIPWKESAIQAMSLCDHNHGPGVFVGTRGQHEMSLWDIAGGRCKTVFRYSSDDEQSILSNTTDRGYSAMDNAAGFAAAATTQPLSDPVSKSKELGVVELRSLSTQACGIRAILCDQNTGSSVITGGSDRCIRCWDYLQPLCSYAVVHPRAGIPAKRKYAVTMADSGVVDVTEERRDRDEMESDGKWVDATSHEETIVDMVRVKGLQDDLLVSASMEGTVKVWR